MTNAARTPNIDSVEVGLILTDWSFKSVGFDRGAALMLGYATKTSPKAEPSSCIPREIFNMIRNHDPADLPFAKTYFRVGKSEYVCRVHIVDLPDRLCKEPLLAIHLEKATFVNGAVFEIASRYHLTVREAEVLRGICIGLSPKELAKRLGISPNTVKSFLRLIMTKMGVTTRAELFAVILEHQGKREGKAAEAYIDGTAVGDL